MGFGHRVYEHGDSRVPTMRAALQAVAEQLAANALMRSLSIYNGPTQRPLPAGRPGRLGAGFQAVDALLREHGAVGEPEVGFHDRVGGGGVAVCDGVDEVAMFAQAASQLVVAVELE